MTSYLSPWHRSMDHDYDNLSIELRLIQVENLQSVIFKNNTLICNARYFWKMNSLSLLYHSNITSEPLLTLHIVIACKINKIIFISCPLAWIQRLNLISGCSISSVRVDTFIVISNVMSAAGRTSPYIG